MCLSWTGDDVERRLVSEHTPQEINSEQIHQSHTASRSSIGGGCDCWSILLGDEIALAASRFAIVNNPASNNNNKKHIAGHRKKNINNKCWEIISDRIWFMKCVKWSI